MLAPSEYNWLQKIPWSGSPPPQGGHKVWEKNSPSFPGFSRAINLLFHRLSQQKVNVIMTFIKGHDDPVYPVNSCSTQIFEWRTKNTLFVTIFPWGCTEFPEFSMFREIPEYSRFSRFVATLHQNLKTCPTKRILSKPARNFLVIQRTDRHRWNHNLLPSVEVINIY